MKRLLSCAIVFSLATQATSCKTYSDKTYINLRSQGVNLATEDVLWHKLMKECDEDKIGGTVQAAVYYEASDNKRDLGEYFGVRNSKRASGGCCIDDFISVGLDKNNTGAILLPQSIIHKEVNVTTPGTPLTLIESALADNVYLRPSRESVVLRLDWHQRLDMLFKGIYFKFNLPIVFTRHKVGASSGSCCPGTTLKQAKGNNTGFTVLDYLAGNVTVSDTGFEQTCLKKMKVVCGSHSKTGIADIDLELGYYFLDCEQYRLGLNFGVTFPTGNSPCGEYLFDPVVGNGGHWGVGFGIDGVAKLFECGDNFTMDFRLVLDYRYLLEDTEWRAATPKENGQWSLYKLAGKVGQTGALFPLANELTRKYDVTPGSQVDMIAAFNFNWCGFTMDLGYNLFARESEEVENKCCNAADLAIPIGDTLTTTPPLTSYRTNDPLSGSKIAQTISSKDLCMSSIETPTVVTHKLYGGVGYTFREWCVPLMVGGFASYEWIQNNCAAEQWAVGGKLAVAF